MPDDVTAEDVATPTTEDEKRAESLRFWSSPNLYLGCAWEIDPDDPNRVEALAYGTAPTVVDRLEAGGCYLDLRDAVIFTFPDLPRAGRLRRVALAGRLWWQAMRASASSARGASGACWAFARGRLNEPPNPLADVCWPPPQQR
ncbi:MAG TPA: hypothetical protein VFU94_14930 [Conexibacter sp.]|nr:hypothetical protein [Conexibacter sp.]